MSLLHLGPFRLLHNSRPYSGEVKHSSRCLTIFLSFPPWLLRPTEIRSLSQIIWCKCWQWKGRTGPPGVGASGLFLLLLRPSVVYSSVIQFGQEKVHRLLFPSSSRTITCTRTPIMPVCQPFSTFWSSSPNNKMLSVCHTASANSAWQRGSFYC